MFARKRLKILKEYKALSDQVEKEGQVDQVDQVD